MARALARQRRDTLVGAGEPGVRAVRTLAVGRDGAEARQDRLAVEEPLEIRLRAAGVPTSRVVAVTMRTPGRDRDLALGFLVSEGLISHGGQVTGIDGPSQAAGENRVVVELASSHSPDLGGLERHFFASSACGVCGRAGLERLSLAGVAPLAGGPVIEASRIAAFPARLRGAQAVFDQTGGLHAAGLFDASGNLLDAAEDVGRHNAVDKVVGWAFSRARLPLSGHCLMVSGRASFEVIQKAAVAGIPIVAAVSAPSSLAVDTAERFGMTLVGFLRGDGFNVYSGASRIAVRSDARVAEGQGAGP